MVDFGLNFRDNINFLALSGPNNIGPTSYYAMINFKILASNGRKNALKKKGKDKLAKIFNFYSLRVEKITISRAVKRKKVTRLILELN